MPLPPPPPALTPPAQVRKLTHEQLVAKVTRLEEQRAEDYVAIRDLVSRVDTNHLIYLDCFGQLARLMGGKIKLEARKDIKP